MEYPLVAAGFQGDCPCPLVPSHHEFTLSSPFPICLILEAELFQAEFGVDDLPVWVCLTACLISTHTMCFYIDITSNLTTLICWAAREDPCSNGCPPGRLKEVKRALDLIKRASAPPGQSAIDFAVSINWIVYWRRRSGASALLQTFSRFRDTLTSAKQLFLVQI